jgi:vacuolar-type H+-ATPase subunit F/Vma7
MKVAVVGRAEVIAPFAGAGLDVVPAEAGPAAAATVRALVRSGCAVVFYTEDLQPYLAGLLAEYSHEALPCLSMLPMGGGGAGLQRLSEIVKRAVGADVFGAGR